MPQYRYLEHGEIIKATDEYDACNDGWRDEPVWKPVKTRIGQPAPDPKYPAHTIYRRRLTFWERFRRWMTAGAAEGAAAGAAEAEREAQSRKLTRMLNRGMSK